MITDIKAYFLALLFSCLISYSIADYMNVITQEYIIVFQNLENNTSITLEKKYTSELATLKAKFVDGVSFPNFQDVLLVHSSLDLLTFVDQFEIYPNAKVSLEGIENLDALNITANVSITPSESLNKTANVSITPSESLNKTATVASSGPETLKNTVLFIPTNNWNLQRISSNHFRAHRHLNYTFKTLKDPGFDVRIYVLDTGINQELSEFTNRVDSSLSQSDNNGHGTRVASIIAGTTMGISRNATLIPIKIISDNQPSSNVFMIYKGLVSTFNQITHSTPKPSIINMSFRIFDTFPFIDSIIKRLVSLTDVFIVSSSSIETCHESPKLIHDVIFTASVNEKNKATLFSKCVDVYAPGFGIHCISKQGNEVISNGVSYAAAHVSGVIASLVSNNSTGCRTSKCMKRHLIKHASSMMGTSKGIVYNDVK